MLFDLMKADKKLTQHCRFDYFPAGPQLSCAYKRPSSRKIAAVNSGEIELALFEHGQVLFILHKIHGLEHWSDCSFSACLDPESSTDWTDLLEETNTNLKLTVTLTDSDTNVVKALRCIELPVNFSIALRDKLSAQLERPFSSETYKQNLLDCK